MSTLARACGLLACVSLCACFEGPHGVVVGEATDLAAADDLGVADLAVTDAAQPADLAVADLAVADTAEPVDLLTPDLTMVDLAHAPEVLIEDFCPMSLTGYVRCYVHARPPDGY